jgi:PAS domain S-box-containing protein
MTEKPAYEELEKRVQELEQGKSVDKQTEEALKLFKESVDNSSDAIGISTPEGRHYYQNKAFDQMFGTIGETSSETIYVNQDIGEEVFSAIMSGRQWTGEVKMYAKDKTIRDVFLRAYANKDEHGNITALVGIHSDITERMQTEEALRENEAHLRTLIETIPDLVWLKDPDGVYISCNLKFERFFGAKETIIKGKTDHDFVDKELADFFTEKDKAVMAAAIPIVNEEEVTFADDGHKELLETIKTPMYDSEGKLVGVLGIARDITERKHAENLVRDLSQRLMQAQERERKMISCELHDSIAQDLSTLKLYCNRLFERQSSSESDIKVLSKDVSTLIDQTITTVRDLAYDLRPPSLDDLGLVYALEAFCEEFTEKNNIMVDFQAAGIHESKLNSDTQINLYRLMIEGLNNIRKHAAASKVIIRLVGAYPNVILRIEDNGKGFDIKERERSTLNEKRMGLRSMKERANLLQGQMSIHSQLNKGTQILIKLPLKDKE